MLNAIAIDVNAERGKDKADKGKADSKQMNIDNLEITVGTVVAMEKSLLQTDQPPALETGIERINMFTILQNLDSDGESEEGEAVVSHLPISPVEGRQRRSGAGGLQSDGNHKLQQEKNTNSLSRTYSEGDKRDLPVTDNLTTFLDGLENRFSRAGVIDDIANQPGLLDEQGEFLRSDEAQPGIGLGTAFDPQAGDRGIDDGNGLEGKFSSSQDESEGDGEEVSALLGKKSRKKTMTTKGREYYLKQTQKEGEKRSKKQAQKGNHI